MWKIMTVIGAAVLLVVAMQGCTPGGIDPGIADGIREQLLIAQRELQAARESVNDPDREARIEKYQEKVNVLTDAYNAVVREDGSVDTSAVIRESIRYLPFPADIIALGVMGISGVIAGWQKKRANQKEAEAREDRIRSEVAELMLCKETDACKSIVNALDVVRSKHPEVCEAMDACTEQIHAQLTERAKAIIAEERLT